MKTYLLLITLVLSVPAFAKNIVPNVSKKDCITSCWSQIDVSGEMGSQTCQDYIVCDELAWNSRLEACEVVNSEVKQKAGAPYTCDPAKKEP